MSEPIAEMRMHFDLPAERLRIRKGQTVRYTIGDTVRDYRVLSVSMPDARGDCRVTLGPT